MFEAIGLIASLIEVSTKVYSGGRWVQKKLQEWKVPSSIGLADKQFKFLAEYFSLTTDAGLWREFKLGREKLREEKRLLHDRTRLMELYPGLSSKLLVDMRIGQMPYEVLTYKLQEVELVVQNSKFRIRPALRDIYDATYTSLVEHYRRVGIQYEPTQLPRACNWVRGKLTIEQAEYTDAASTNMMADLNIETALNKTALLENNSGTCNTIREYDQSLAEKPGCYPSFKKSSLANPIGVAGIAITADNKLILTHRSRRVSSYAYRLGPSSSGYVTWHDMLSSKEKTLNSLLITGLKREIAEELHLDLSRDISELYPLGFFREFYRAGMPQAFYCFRIQLTAEELVSRMRDAQDFRECIGVLSISVNRQLISRIITTLVRAQKIGSLSLGLEVQGLLTALALNGEDFLFAEEEV
jgi:hypothetical protein